MSEEIYKSIPGYEQIYQASNLGKIRSLDRFVPSGNNRMVFLKGRVLKQAVGSTGRYHVALNKCGVQKTKKVHQLVAMAFLNHKPNGYKLVVNHINHDPLDNRVENLEIVTHRKNANRKHLKSSSQYTGVSWTEHNKKWRSIIVIDKKNVHLGYYVNELGASLAYDKALLNLKET